MGLNSSQLKTRLEELGFGVAHVRRVPRSSQIRAYIAVKHKDHPDVDEIRYDPAKDEGTVELYQHATKTGSTAQYDRFVGNFTIA